MHWLTKQYFNLEQLLNTQRNLDNKFKEKMGFEDEDYENALRDRKGTQGKLNGTLYKQAGNSIVVQVLEAIFRELLGGGRVE